MKTLISLSMLFLALISGAQTMINKSVVVRPGQKVNLHFDYPELVQVSTWDKNEISIQGSISINGGENDDAFVLGTDGSGNTLYIRSEIKDMKNIPHRITVVQDGKKMVFKTKADYKNYRNEHGANYNVMSSGVDMDILLEIKVPKNTETWVESVYGMVEVKDFVGPLTVEATYGGVDASLHEKNMGKLSAETNYGQIYSNLDIKFNLDNVREETFHTYLSAEPGSGPQYSFESKYGNVYLRRGK